MLTSTLRCLLRNTRYPLRRQQEAARSRRPAGGDEDAELQRAIQESLAMDNDAAERKRRNQECVPIVTLKCCFVRGDVDADQFALLLSRPPKGGGAAQGARTERDRGGYPQA